MYAESIGKDTPHDTLCRIRNIGIHKGYRALGVQKKNLRRADLELLWILLVLLVICLYPKALSPAGRYTPTPPPIFAASITLTPSSHPIPWNSKHKKRHLAVSYKGSAPCLLEGLSVRCINS